MKIFPKMIDLALLHCDGRREQTGRWLKRKFHFLPKRFRLQVSHLQRFGLDSLRCFLVATVWPV
jgi:hypothetical protein